MEACRDERWLKNLSVLLEAYEEAGFVSIPITEIRWLLDIHELSQQTTAGKEG